MARWLEGVEETAFRAVAGGYVFVLPNRWLLGSPSYYLVNDAQKAVIGRCVRKRLRFAMLSSLAFLAVILALTVALVVHLGHLPFAPFLIGLCGGLLMLIPAVIVPHIYYMRTLGPIVKNLPPTGQRITPREQLSSVAAAMPKWRLYVLMAAGSVMVLGGVLQIYDLTSEGRLADRWFGAFSIVAGGAIATAYFTYLFILKRKREKTL